MNEIIWIWEGKVNEWWKWIIFSYRLTLSVYQSYRAAGCLLVEDYNRKEWLTSDVQCGRRYFDCQCDAVNFTQLFLFGVVLVVSRSVDKAINYLMFTIVWVEHQRVSTSRCGTENWIPAAFNSWAVDLSRTVSAARRQSVMTFFTDSPALRDNLCSIYLRELLKNIKVEIKNCGPAVNKTFYWKTVDCFW